MAPASKSEYGTILINAQTAVPIRTTLNKMGWKQGPTSIQVDNFTAVGITTKEFPKEIKGNGYAILKNKRQNQTRTISSLLETGPRKIGGLSFQTIST